MPKITIAYYLPNVTEEIMTHLSRPEVADVITVCDASQAGFCTALNRLIRKRGMNPLLQSAEESLIFYGDLANQWHLVEGAEIIIVFLETAPALIKDYKTLLNYSRETQKSIFFLSSTETFIADLTFQLNREAKAGEDLSILAISADSLRELQIRLAGLFAYIRTYQRFNSKALEWSRSGRARQHLLTPEDIKLIQASYEQLAVPELKQALRFNALQRKLLTASQVAFKHRKKTDASQKLNPEIFISYSRSNKDFTRQVNDFLREENWSTWVDWENIPISANWREEVEQGIESAHTFLFVISPESLKSKHCAWELQLAQGCNTRIVPIVCDDGFDECEFSERNIAEIQYVSFTEQPFESAKSELIQALKIDLDDVKIYKRLFVKASEWQERGRDKSLLLQFNELRKVLVWYEQRQAKAAQGNYVRHDLLPLQQDYIAASKRHMNNRLRLSVLGFSAASVLVLGLSALLTISTVGEIRALISSLEERTSLDALISSLKAGQRLKSNHWIVKAVRPSLYTQTTSALHQSVLELSEYNRLVGHTDTIYQVAFSPDGDHIASVSKDFSLRLWDLEQDRASKPKISHTGDVVALAYSPDGDYLATGSYDGTIKVWSSAGELKKALNPRSTNVIGGDRPRIYEVKFSPGGQYLAAANQAGKVHIWSRADDFSQRMELSHDASSQVGSITFSRHGRYLATADSQGIVKLWDLNGNFIKQVDYENPVRSVQFSPTINTVAVGGEGGEVRVWDLRADTFETLGSHDDTVNQVQFSPDGLALASVSEDNTVKLWENNQLKHTLKGHSAPVFRAQFSADNQILATAGADNNILIWSREEGALLKTLAGHDDEVLSITFSPSPNFEDADLLNSQPSNSQPSMVLASAGKDGVIRLWSMDTLIQTLPHQNRVFDVTYRPDGRVVASAGFNTIRLWRPDAKLRSYLNAGFGQVAAIDYSPDGHLLAAGRSDGGILIWKPDVETNEPLVSFVSHRTQFGQGTWAVKFSPNGQWLATGGEDHTVRIWSVAQLLAKEEAPTYALSSGSIVTDLAFSADGSLIAAAGKPSWGFGSGRVKLWQLPEAAAPPQQEPVELKTITRRSQGHSDDVLSLAFHPQRGLLATGGADKLVKLWDAQGNLVTTLRGQSDSVTDVMFSNDGKFLGIASKDGYVEMRTADGDLISRLKAHDQTITGMAFRPDGGRALATASLDNTVRLWQLWNLPSEEMNKLVNPSHRLNLLLDLGCQQTQAYFTNYLNASDRIMALHDRKFRSIENVQDIHAFCRKQLK